MNATAPAPAAENTSRTPAQRPPLVNKIVLARPTDQPVAKPNNPAKEMTKQSAMLPAMGIFDSKVMAGIQSRLGLRYVYGSEGPNTYDCSGFVWSVFQEAGLSFERSSAANYWNKFEPVEGPDRFKFGTLVFLNGLGHMGIVADENGFYHASRSKGITYSPFAGYWGKRITGYRRIPTAMYLAKK